MMVVTNQLMDNQFVRKILYNTSNNILGCICQVKMPNIVWFQLLNVRICCFSQVSVITEWLIWVDCQVDKIRSLKMSLCLKMSLLWAYMWNVHIKTPVPWLFLRRFWLLLAAWISFLWHWFKTVKDWFVCTGTSKNGTAFGLQMSQAGFSAHNVEVSLTSATTSTQIICQHAEQHTLSQFLAHQAAIYHFPFTPEVPAVWPQRFRSSWFRGPWQKRQAFFHFNHAVMGNKTPLVPQGNILVRSWDKTETVLLQNGLFCPFTQRCLIVPVSR